MNKWECIKSIRNIAVGTKATIYPIGVGHYAAMAEVVTEDGHHIMLNQKVITKHFKEVV